MSTWTLIILIYAGAWAKGDSVALDHIGGYPDKAACVAAGAALDPLTAGTAKETRYVCVQSK